MVKKKFFNRKSGQIKIQQTAFVLIAVTLFIVLAGMFFFAFKLSDLRETANEIKERETLLLVSKFANSPELTCANSFGTKSNCIDLDKVMAMKQNFEKFGELYDLSNIEIRKIYPSSSVSQECTLSNYPNCNIIRLKKGGLIGFYSSNYVTICRKENNVIGVTDKCEIGILSIGYEPI